MRRLSGWGVGKMTREELEAALREADARARRGTTIMGLPKAIEAAARMQLALMPEKCGTCGGTGSVTLPNATEREYLEGLREDQCPRCRNGKVYPPETVEKIAEAIDSISDEVWGYRGRQAVAVLDALGETE